jgi:hypothetical protein
MNIIRSRLLSQLGARFGRLFLGSDESLTNRNQLQDSVSVRSPDIFRVLYECELIKAVRMGRGFCVGWHYRVTFWRDGAELNRSIDSRNGHRGRQREPQVKKSIPRVGKALRRCRRRNGRPLRPKPEGNVFDNRTF